MSEHFSAFSFVDRITKLEPGVRANGYFLVPPHVRHFPDCLMAEAVGQLAAWVTMAHLDFRGRPVAALAGETRFLGHVVPGQTLDLAVEIERCDDEAVEYKGAASVDGAKVLELEHCLGPMLALEDFDSADAMRAHFALLREQGAASGRFQGVVVPEVAIVEQDPGKWRRATMKIPASAPFFRDHFPRQPVFPATLLLEAQTGLALGLARDVLGANVGGELALARVLDVKVRAFILPGQVVELRADVKDANSETVTMKLGARVDGTAAASARAEIVSRGNA